MSFSNRVENELMDYFIQTHGSQMYIALFDGVPTDDGQSGVEISGNNYSRVLHTSWSAAAGGVVKNATPITFSTPTPDGWGRVTHWAIFDHATDSDASNLLAWGVIDPDVEIQSGVPPVFQTGTLTMTLD